MDKPGNSDPVVGVVGPCGAGKSTLISGLRIYGLEARHIAQEHSYVPRMWEHMVHPDLLIYLQASFPTCTVRRRLNWIEADYKEQLHRLEHARDHADIVIDTDNLRAEAVLQQAVTFLKSHGVNPRNLP